MNICLTVKTYRSRTTRQRRMKNCPNSRNSANPPSNSQQPGITVRHGGIERRCLPCESKTASQHRTYTLRRKSKTQYENAVRHTQRTKRLHQSNIRIANTPGHTTNSRKHHVGQCAAFQTAEGDNLQGLHSFSHRRHSQPVIRAQTSVHIQLYALFSLPLTTQTNKAQH